MTGLAGLLLLLSTGPSFVPSLQDTPDGLEKKVAEIVGRLADDSIDVRDQAVKDLAALGPPALPALKKALVKVEGETKGRVQEAIRAIELRDSLAQSLPPLRKITLDHRNRPAKDAIEEIARQAGLEVKFDGDLARGAITLALQDATPLEALDAVCRQEGGLFHESDRSEYRGFRTKRPAGTPKLSFSGAPFVDFPAVYVRHYRIRIEQVSLTRTNTFKGTDSGGSLQMELRWLPDTHPDGLLRFEVTELKDDQGRPLLPEKKDPDDAMFHRTTYMRHSGYRTETQESIEFRHPEPDAKKIAILKGVAVLLYRKETKTLVFEKAAEAKGKSLEIHGVKITLDDYQIKGTDHQLKFVMTGKYDGPKDPAREAMGRSMGDRFPFSTDEIEVVTESGTPLTSMGMSGRGGGETYTITITYHAQKAETLKEIRIPCVLSHHLDEVPFQLKDIALPK